MKTLRKFAISLLVLCGVALCGCRSPFVPRQVELGQEQVVVPMRLENNDPLVEVFINGQGPYIFVLDTGSGSTVVSSELAKQLELPEVIVIPGTVRSGSGEKVRVETFVNINSVRMETATFGKFTAALIDFAALPGLLEPGCEGILGFVLFSEILLTMDFPSGKVVIEKGELPKPNKKDVIPMNLNHSQPIIGVSVCGVRRRFLIDTGDPGYFTVSDRLVDKKLPIKKRLEGDFKVSTIAGVERRWYAELDGQIQLGHYRFSNPIVAVESDKDDGSIGVMALKYFAVTFDQQRKSVRLRPIRFAALKGLTIRMGGDTWLVVEVKKDSRAEQLALRAGDEIVQINDQPIADLWPDGMKKLSQQKKIYKLIVERDGQRIEIEVPKEESGHSSH